MSKRDVPRRHEWLPTALPVIFGEEPEWTDPWPGLLDALVKLESLTVAVSEGALHRAEALGAAGDGLLAPRDTSVSTAQGEAEDLAAPMRIVLMGRTMAGKSSLLTALTGFHHDRIGDGRQRFSRDVFGAAMSVSEHIELVDTPGVGAHGGADDTEKALAAALDADVILWVNSSDSIQQESAAALKLLGLIGKPIIVALNCRQSLEGVGRLNLLRFPDRVFGHREGLLDEIRRHMAVAGVKPLEVVHVHALAAAEALAYDEVDTELHAASRIADLTDALLREHEAHRESRRALRLIDNQRQPAEELARSLQLASATLRARAEHNRGMYNDMHERLRRAVRSTGEAMESDVEAAVGRRRDWHLDAIDFGKSLESDWNDAVEALQDELQKTLEHRLTSLADEIRSTIEATDAEWSNVSLDQFGLRNLPGFGAVWGNRLIRAGVGAGGSLLGFAGGAWLGAQIGGALGLAAGPAAIVTAGAGFVIGGIAGLAAGRIKSLVDHIFLGKDGVLQKRRDEVAKQVGPILDELTSKYRAAIGDQLNDIRDVLGRELARSHEQSAALELVASEWTKGSENLQASVRELDRQTTSALLRIDRRERLARAVKRATRVPGVCILVEFDDAGFAESWLFPPDVGETLAGGKASTSGGEAASALSYALSFVEAPMRLVRADAASALLSIAADIPSAIAETWAVGLEAHLARRVQIETT
ncbi:GTPase domain-containing protein [Cellulomonas alba]|uniref:GTPase domain-containing protein n=1 Tax=Cellulomonas alba TaxID=3053467 RepID=A0ABT7SBV5_9CELL|nr:GTPase domain-containing protein [Cellulomonas alba]MDM7853668.1 GTPase domain-containing protein [Cellulomonas alba]